MLSAGLDSRLFDYCLIYTATMLYGWFDNLHALKEDFIYLRNESLWY